jgi:hypothetical protein
LQTSASGATRGKHEAKILRTMLATIRLAKQAEVRQNPSTFGRKRAFCRILTENHMADETDVQETGEVRFKPSPQLWRYLGWLARNTVLGRNEHEVARQVLTTKLTEMRRDEYHDPERQ